jgi:hypothetical protein
MTIDLSKARSAQEVDVLAGRDKGEYWRGQFSIDALDRTEGEVRVHVPNDLSLLSLSFFLNLFGKSVRMFGREAFLAKYRFEGNTALDPQIEKGISQALKRGVGIPRAS